MQVNGRHTILQNIIIKKIAKLENMNEKHRAIQRKKIYYMARTISTAAVGANQIDPIQQQNAPLYP